MKLPMLSHDKANHFVYGAVITSLLGAKINISIGLIVCVILAILKEFYDSKHPTHRCDAKDVVATVLGGLVVALPFVVK